MIANTYAGLVPRDLTAEVVFDASRFARGFLAIRVCLTACFNLLVRIYVPRFARNFCCWEYALRRYLLVVG